MNSQTSVSRAELEVAEVTLRGVLVEEFRQEAKADAQSLDRMLKHLVNMNGAISSSPETHANVAKRLVDFANTTTRMADRNPEAAPQLAKLAEALRKASERLVSEQTS
jgi:uncharacterized damage-inducible protein DinB